MSENHKRIIDGKLGLSAQEVLSQIKLESVPNLLSFVYFERGH